MSKKVCKMVYKSAEYLYLHDKLYFKTRVIFTDAEAGTDV